MRRNRHDGAAGFSMVELAIVIGILGILFVMASAMLARARVNSNEASAVASLRTINTAQFAYLNGCGSGFYAASLPILATKVMANSQGYLQDDLGGSATPLRSGYRYAMTLGAGGTQMLADCMGRTTMSSYYLTAVPDVLGDTGSRSFATSEKGPIWQLFGASPPTQPFGPPAEYATN